LGPGQLRSRQRRKPLSHPLRLKERLLAFTKFGAGNETNGTEQTEGVYFYGMNDDSYGLKSSSLDFSKHFLEFCLNTLNPSILSQGCLKQGKDKFFAPSLIKKVLDCDER
jgi:hypothetical protein